MKKFAVIVAGGSGTRMKSVIPKQFMLLAGTPVLMHTLQKFHDFDATIELIVVLPKVQLDEWQVLCSVHSFRIPHRTAVGGETRFHSVQKGLECIEEAGIVAIHDGVRPLVNKSTLLSAYSGALAHGNAVPSIPLSDSIRKIIGTKNEAQVREHFRMIQTPQCFQVDVIKKAYSLPFQASFTDCASVLEAAGGAINLVEGNVENIKITNPADLIFAEQLITK
ncbi:MAG: 2-C-methyl-D-erythritol 4-phosphate cytidylyltransferase [Bacteroidetes bacterium]|nr:2-C-methyl-D-erythritol 4-phosphate cytidylyltransferase [Bacteroidota bacterium]